MEQAAAIAAPDRSGGLPHVLAEVAVSVNGEPAPLSFVSGEQINFVVPHSAALGEAQVQVRSHGQLTGSGSVTIARLVPGLFTVDSSGAGAGIIRNATTFGGPPFPSHTPERL